MSVHKYLIAVIGPTAIGKTAMAIKIANHFGCDIISCDSRQFFKEMGIGTAVPSQSELDAAKHHFLHNKSIFEEYTVGDFEKEAISKLDELFRTNDFAVMVGGSGLYVDAVLKGFDDFPEVDPAIRKGLTENYKVSGIQYLQDELKRLDPEYFASVDTENPQRLMRALEVTIGSGKPYSSF
jgi:tRNA dimethylallyltransferase